MLLALALALAAGGAAAAEGPGGAAPPEAGPPAHPGAEGRVVEEIVAVFRNPPSSPPRVITLTRLVEEARIVLVSRGGAAAATAPLDRAALRAALDWLLDQMLVADEAAKLRLDEVERDAVVSEVHRFQGRFQGTAAYQRFLAQNELSEEELAATLARTLRVERYVQSRVGRSVRAADDEVDRWLRERGVSAPAPSAREAVRSQLTDEKARAQVRELLSELRSRAEIRIVGQLGQRDGA